ncbi:hypothetical protein [Staphylococcus chromogenes]|uniref:hypothetical protein n=1 Tax=Staphylococcus chromogenes TaxID=46126 RepID=UPI002886CD14|nr:hypothetical protein [Staphylococcus chromogenes]MDT0700419.1 hypothetical protein [Staphylococcus chromogenes]
MLTKEKWIKEELNKIIGVQVHKKVLCIKYIARFSKYIISHENNDVNLKYELYLQYRDKLLYLRTHKIMLTHEYINNYLDKQNKGYEIHKDFLFDDLLILIKNLLNKRLMNIN